MRDEQDALEVEASAQPAAAAEVEVRARHEANREAWNEGASYYSKGNDEAIAS